MIRLLVSRFIRNAEDVQDKHVREQYGVLSGVLGVLCNTLLFLTKLTIGILMNSIAIISDAFNNFSDMGSSLVSIISAKMSNKRPDKEHPFGHGRIEYVSSFIIAFLIMMVGLELAKSSIDKMLHPQPVEFSWVLTGILSLSILIKVWMYVYNRYLGRTISSSVLLATARDSLNDVIATSAVIVSTVIGAFVSFPVDGIIGLLVSGLVLYTGFDIAKETVGVLLGSPPSKELVESIRREVMSNEDIKGIHDLIVHDYGPGRVMASLHAEVPDDINIVKIHEVIDETEQRVRRDMGIELVIHMDPIAQNCEETEHFKKIAEEAVHMAGEDLTFHDFRIVKGENRINLIFDLVIPYSYSPKQGEAACEEIENLIQQKDSRCHTVIQVDHSYYEG
ncbi:MAG: cation transporter [Clostridiales bacterium]|nr:cation transporter [Clostridiales bacterium]